MKDQGRVDWIDVCKGIGIFFVVIGHTMISGTARGYIYSFHMPLFFLLSGYLYSIRKYNGFGSFLISKVKSLLIPYVCFSIIAIISIRVLLHQSIDIKAFVHTFIISKRNSLYFDDPLWFLTSLFTIEIIYFFMEKYIKISYVKLLLTLAMSYLSYIIFNPLAGTNILPWSFDQSLFYIYFFGMGRFIKEIKVFSHNLKKSYVLIIFSVLHIYLFFGHVDFSKISVLIMNYTGVSQNIYMYVFNVLSTLLAIGFWIYVSSYLSFAFVLKYLGRNSLIILALHVCIGFNVTGQIILGKIFSKLGIVITNPNLLGTFFTIAALLVLVPCIYIINKYFPFILGKYTSFSKVFKKQGPHTA